MLLELDLLALHIFNIGSCWRHLAGVIIVDEVRLGCVWRNHWLHGLPRERLVQILSWEFLLGLGLLKLLRAEGGIRTNV